MTRLLSLTALLVVTFPLFAQPNFETPKAVALDAESQKQIDAKFLELKTAFAAIPQTVADDIRIDVEIYVKAVEWIIRHGEYFAKDSGKQTLNVIDAGMKRAAAAKNGKAPWRDARNKPIARAYRSEIDGSIQPYSVLLPDGYEKAEKPWRLDIVLHGRDATLTEVKFLNAKENAKAGAKTDRVVMEIYGRGNNAYRWAGEQDVLEPFGVFEQTEKLQNGKPTIDRTRVVLRGFSMGGAGSWHLGLHYPGLFAAVSPGAGFTNTHGYIKNLGTLPDYQERTLRIYDSYLYAENAFNVPIVAYSGEKDGQKAAADNIEKALANFKEPLRFKHIVAPGLEHKQPPEWLAKIEEEFQKYVPQGREEYPKRVRFVTYTLRYYFCDWVYLSGLEKHYEKAVVDATATDESFTVTTTNVTELLLAKKREAKLAPALTIINGDKIEVPQKLRELPMVRYGKRDGRWAIVPEPTGLRKYPGLQGPIDDVFHHPFSVVAPTGNGISETTGSYTSAAHKRMAREWDKYMRGSLPTGDTETAQILFGDPKSNPAIQQVLPNLPIKWTAEKLVMNGKEYDAKTHVPVMIYPHPKVKNSYVVLNSGYTFHEDAFKGTNALLYPRLGDWAVLKPKPTKDDPAAAEVVDAGIFDEKWQFAK